MDRLGAASYSLVTIPIENNKNLTGHYKIQVYSDLQKVVSFKCINDQNLERIEFDQGAETDISRLQCEGSEQCGIELGQKLIILHLEAKLIN